MTIDKYIVIISGIIGIGFVYWFFLSSESHEHQHH